MKKYKYFLFGLFILTAMLAIYGWNEYNRPPVKVSDVEAKIEISGKDLIDLFEANWETESKKFANKIIQLNGEITAIYAEESTIVIDSKIRCEMDGDSKLDLTKLKIKSPIIIKGFFGGFDDLLEEVLFVRCVYTH